MTNDNGPAGAGWTGRVRRAVGFLVGNRASRIYLGLVLAAALFLVWDLLTHDGPDASFAGIYLILLTSPWWLLSAPLMDAGPEWVSAVVWITATLVGALANAALIGGAVSLFRNGRSSPRGTDRPRPSGASPGS
jgi:hypothetical protein